MNPENEAYASLLDMHLQGIVRRLRRLPAELWDWTPHVAAPTARILAAHTYQWLVCDRQHIGEPDALKHPYVPEPPTDPKEMCDVLEAEAKRWNEMILAFTPEELATPRRQYNMEPAVDIRWFVCHMIQNSIYKHGQLATLYFALELDGSEPYDAPFPNIYYKELHDEQMKEQEA